MQLKNLFKRKSLTITIAGLVFFVTLIIYSVPKISTQNSSEPLTANASAFFNQEKVNSPLPVRLKIPSINIDAVVQNVGITSDGAMDVPKGPDDVAWFDLGTVPGENGTAVIDGHSGWKDSIPAVFDNLYKLQKGDKIDVDDNKGATITFVVREIRIYDPKADAEDVFSSNDGKSHLNLITCGGVWNEITRTHSKRLVVFTDKEMEFRLIY